MGEESWHRDHHYDLYRERARSMSRYVGVTLIFAILALLKVVMPYADLTARLSGEEKDLAGLEVDRKKNAEEQERVRDVAQRIAVVNQEIGGVDWEDRAEDLVSVFRSLSDSYETLLAADRKCLETALVLSEAQEAPGPDGEKPMPQRPPDEERQAPPGPGDPEHPDPEIIARLRADPELREEVLALQAGIWQFRMDREDLAAWSEDRREFLGERYRVRAREEADRVVETIVEDVERGLLGPMHVLVGHPDVARSLPDLPPAVEKLQGKVLQWKKDSLEHSAWFETVPGKFRAIGSVSQAVWEWVTTSDQTLSGSRDALMERDIALENDAQKIWDQSEATRGAREDLVSKVQGLMPSFLEGVLSSEEVFRLYPAGILVLLLLTTSHAWRLRQHLGWLRANGHENLPLRSLWAPARRGLPGGATHLGAQLLCLVGIWLLFEAGAGQASQVMEAGLVKPLEGVGGYLGAIPWVGRAIFAVLAYLVIQPMLKASGTGE